MTLSFNRAMFCLENEIVELLRTNQCVIISDFGGFVSSYQSAKINLSEAYISYPCKNVLFNYRLTKDDALLSHAISIKYNLSFDEAKNYISEKVAIWKNSMLNGESIFFHSIGELRLNNENNIIFIPIFQNFNSLESYGLNNAFLEVNENFSQNIELEFNDAPKTNNNLSFSWKKTIKFVAAACLLPILFFSVWIPLKTDFLESGVININELNPFINNKNSLYKMKNISDIEFLTKINVVDNFENDINHISNDVNIYSYEFDNDLFIPVRLNNNFNANINNYDLKYNNIKQTSYVLGSFSNENNAKKLVESLLKLNINAEILNINSFSRVIVKSNSNNYIKKLKVLGFNPWVLNN